jgi:DNA-binding MarR family transcriptional regulator
VCYNSRVTGDPQTLAGQLDDLLLAVRSATSDRSGLSLTAAATLSRLQREGPARLTELAAAEGITQPSMTALVTRLAEQGLVQRASDPSDGRAVLLSLTPAGADFLAQRRTIRTDRLAPYLAGLSPDERRDIATAMPALNRLTGALRRSPTTPEVTLVSEPASSRENRTAPRTRPASTGEVNS